MFASLLRSRKHGPETTPLLAALNRYRNRYGDDERSVSEDDQDGTARYDGGDEDYEDEDPDRRDGPLLPVFSAEFLGMRSPLTFPLPDALTPIPRSHPHLQYHALDPHNRNPAL